MSSVLRMDDIRADQRAWLRQVLDQTKMSGTALAKAAGLAQTTVTNFVNDPDYPHALSARTIAALERASRMKFGAMPRETGFSEAEAAPLDVAAEAEIVADAVKRLIAGRDNALAPWRLNSRAIEAAGYLPGDVLVVDLGLNAMPGDIVCAQRYQWNRMSAETIFRVYEPPYLLAKTFDPATPALLAVDNVNIVIKGVVVASFRPRQARAA